MNFALTYIYWPWLHRKEDSADLVDLLIYISRNAYLEVLSHP